MDGVPLAIELAAANTRVLSAEQIASRLGDSFWLLKTHGRMVDHRQQTLRTAIDWSHQSLSKEERSLFRRLSVFAGGFALEHLRSIYRKLGVPTRAAAAEVAVERSLI